MVSQSFTVKDFGGVETGAVEHVGDFVNIWEAGEASHDVEDLADVLEDLLGIEIGGIFQDRLDEVQQGLFNLNALVGANGRGHADVPAYSVIVTKRRVKTIEWVNHDLNWHAALEWTVFDYGDADWLVGNPTIAAYESSGKLRSERNDPSERNNLFAGTVSAATPFSVSVWLALVESDKRYCDDLDYFWPGCLDLVAPEHYNSNGFASGIIQSISGTTTAPMETYFKGDKPVPIVEFQRDSCQE